MNTGTFTMSRGMTAKFKQDPKTGLYEVWRDRFPYFWWKDVPSIKNLVCSFPRVLVRAADGSLDQKYNYGLKFRKPVNERQQENRRGQKKDQN